MVSDSAGFVLFLQPDTCECTHTLIYFSYGLKQDTADAGHGMTKRKCPDMRFHILVRSWAFPKQN